MAYREFIKPQKLLFRDLKQALTARSKRLREGRPNKRTVVEHEGGPSCLITRMSTRFCHEYGDGSVFAD